MAIDELLKTGLKVSGKCEDFKAAKDSKTNNNWQTLPTTGIDYRHLKKNRQMLKGDEYLNELQSTNLTKRIATPLERNMKSLAIVDAVNPLKVHKRLSRTSVESKDLSALRLDAAFKGNKLKINLRKHVCSSSQKQDNLSVGLTNVTVLGNSSPKLPNEYEFQKPYKLKENVAPSAIT